VPIGYSISRIIKVKISSTLVSLAATTAAAIAPVAVAGYYANIIALPSSQSQASIAIGSGSTSGVPRTGDTFLFNSQGGATFSSFTQQGIGLYMTELASGAAAQFQLLQGFQSSEAFVMTWYSVNFGGGGSTLILAKFDDWTASGGGQQIGLTIDVTTTPGPVTLDATVGNEYYRLVYASSGSGPISQPGLQLMDVDFTAVPAPGALALLGVVGLAGRRRRS
jgi:MYXO-CTERM domain-containing protein